MWGGQTQKLPTSNGTSLWSEDEGAQSNPTSTLDESLPPSHHVVPWAQEKSPVPQSKPGTQRTVANVDTAVLVADRQGLQHPFTIALPVKDKGVYSAIGYAFNDPGKERTVHVDQYGGQVLATYGYADYPALAKVVSQGIALHEGRRFSTLNFWLTTVFCLLVISSCITGPLMWWRRRPKSSDSIGAPRGRMPLKSSPLLQVMLILLGVFLPLFGASVLLSTCCRDWSSPASPRLHRTWSAVG